MTSPFTPEQIWYQLSLIPEGKVVTYGQLGEMVGTRNAGRVVGNILSRLPNGGGLPWHRVINHKGEISFAKDSSRYTLQKERLEAEGVVFTNGRIDLSIYRWHGE